MTEGGISLNDIDFLPQALKGVSLSDREIVLTHEDASHAIDFLEAEQRAVLGWEPWLKHVNGSHYHPVMGGSFEPEKHETWAAYVHRTAQLCRQVIHKEQERWDAGEFFRQEGLDGREMTLYFCLVIAAEHDL